jgi:hypothetical protein
VREVFTPVELLQALLYLLKEPCVMIDVMLDQLLNVAVRIGAVLGGDAIKLRVQIGAAMDFYALTAGAAGFCQLAIGGRNCRCRRTSAGARTNPANSESIRVFALALKRWRGSLRAAATCFQTFS